MIGFRMDLTYLSPAQNSRGKPVCGYLGVRGRTAPANGRRIGRIGVPGRNSHRVSSRRLDLRWSVGTRRVDHAFRRNAYGQGRSHRSDASQVGVPTWSPDGKRIAYIRSNWAYNARTSAIEVNEWQKATAETIFSDSRLSPALHWLPDDRLIYAFGSAQRQQDSSLWIVALQQSRRISSPPKRIAEGHGWISQVTAGRDGKHVIFLRGNWLPSVYVATLAADGGSCSHTRRLTLDENENIPWSWTPDSKAVLFSSDRNGTREIFRQAIDQPLAESLVTSEDHVSQPRITPDGSEIVYISAT